MGHIFLSYSRKDIDLMHRIRDDLIVEGLEVWTDESLVTGSQSWKQDVGQAIEKASALVVILTPNAKNSTWVQEEMNYAEAQDVRIFPVLAEGTTKSAVPFGFITAQWVDIRREADYPAQMQELIFTLRVHLGFENLIEETRRIQPEAKSVKPVASPPPAQTQFPKNISKAIMVLQNRESQWWRKVDALNHLANLRDERVLPVLRAYLDDDDLDVRQAAQKAIDHIVKPLDITQESGALELENTLLTVDVTKNRPQSDTLDDEVEISDSDAISTTPKSDTTSDRFKLVITGPLESQRKAFIGAISEIDPVVISREIKPSDTQRIQEVMLVAMSYGRIHLSDDLMVYLFGMPANEKFDFMWKILSEGMLGFVFLVDATQPDTFEDARNTFETFRTHANVPYVIGVDNLKTPTAWKLEDIRIALRLRDDDKLLPYMSTSEVSVRNILLQLTYLILDDIES